MGANDLLNLKRVLIQFAGILREVNLNSQMTYSEYQHDREITNTLFTFYYKYKIRLEHCAG